ncbi:MAG: hypothetical protein ACNA8P_02440 [Phycisphaerales bacterium]
MLKSILNTAALCTLLLSSPLAGASNGTASLYFQFSDHHEPGFSGGEFIANLSNGTTYRTFCLQRHESIGLGSNVTYAYTIDADGARSGVISGGTPESISSAAASIFVAWLRGSIPNNPENSTAVQNAIWAIQGGLSEDEIQSIGGTALALYNDAITNFSTTDNAPTDNPLFRNIRALNPYRIIDGDVYTYQSQIIFIPLPAASGLALAGIALITSRRRR